MPVVIVSDVHCDGPASPTQADFLRFLAVTPCSTLVLLGDIFHAFAAPNGEAFAAYLPVLEVLAGRHLVVLPGNHDWALPDFLAAGTHVVTAHPHRGSIGARVDIGLGGLRAVLSHGDEVDQSWNYRSFHAVLRSRAFAAAVDAMGPKAAWSLLHRLAGPLGGGKPNPELVAAQRAMAQDRLAAGAELVVTGHTHAPCCENLPGGVWLNPGDWVTHRTFGVVENGGVELRRFEG